LLHSKDFRFVQSGVNHDDVSGISIFRNANYTGGNGGSSANGGFGWTNTAQRIYSYIGENARSNEWGQSVVVFNKAPGTGSPISENCAHYAVGYKQARSDGQPTTFTFGAVSEVVDQTFNPTKGSVAHEFDVTVKGPNNTDVNNTRVGTYLAIRSETGTEGGNEVSLGHATVIFTGTHLKTLFNLQKIGGTVGNYFNFPDFKVSGTGVITNKSTIVARASGEANEAAKFAITVDGTEFGRIYVDASGHLNVAANGSAKVRLNTVTPSFEPLTDNTLDNGGPANRWNDTYQANAAIVSSDGRLKTSIVEFTDDELDVIGEVNIGIYQLLSSIETKGDEARHHVGVIAQQIEECFYARNIDVRKFGFWCSNPWMEMVDEIIEVEEPDTESFVNYRSAIVVRDGKAYEEIESFTEERQTFDNYLVFNDDGTPVMVPAVEAKYGQKLKDGHSGEQPDDYETVVIREAIPSYQKIHSVPKTKKVPKTVKVSRQKVDPITGEPIFQLSIRYEQLTMALIAWMKRELTLLKNK